jgi:N-methylhydantoinase B
MSGAGGGGGGGIDAGDADADADVDLGTVEVVRNYLVSASREMQRTLTRTAYNTVIYEALDFGISIYDRELNLVADSPGLSLFLGTNDYAIEKGVEYVGEGNMHPGDVYILNYPYWSSAHTLDVVLFAPLFVGDDLVGYAAICAHWLDLGQKDAGYVHDSTDVHQEGILFPGTRVYEGGEPNEAVLELLRFNSRIPEKVIGDLNAQVAAIETGRKRMVELYERYGAATVEACIDRILAHGEETARAGVRDLPDGTWTAVDHLDNDGVNDELVRMEVEITIDGDRFTADFSGSSDQVDGPINVPFGSTETMCKVGLKTLATPDEPSNGGHYAPLEVIAPEGNLFHATYPAPTFTLWASIVGVELVYEALAQGMPDRVPAGSGGDVCSVLFVGTDPDSGRMFVEGENAGVGWGGTDTHDGGNAQMHVSETLVQNLPVEVLESKTPVRIDRFELRQDSGGAGRYRGGLGVRRDYRVTEPVTSLTNIKKTRTTSWGLRGGQPGERNAVVLYPHEGWEDRIDLRVDNDDLYEDTEGKKWTGMFYGEFEAGEVVSNRSGGGGGYGDPFERDPAAVRADVRDGYVSRAAARDEYGVVLDDDGTVDREATERLRERERERQ